MLISIYSLAANRTIQHRLPFHLLIKTVSIFLKDMDRGSTQRIFPQSRNASRSKTRRPGSPPSPIAQVRYAVANSDAFVTNINGGQTPSVSPTLSPRRCWMAMSSCAVDQSWPKHNYTAGFPKPQAARGSSRWVTRMVSTISHRGLSREAMRIQLSSTKLRFA